MAIAFKQFLGENRAIEAGLLPAGQCTVSINQRPGRGDLRAWRAPGEVMTVPGAPQRRSIYRMGRDVARDDAYWHSWPGVVHAVRGFDAEDTTERTYYTGDGAPKVMDNLALSSSSPSPNPTVSRPLGVPAPRTALNVTVTPSSETGDEDPTPYFYVYTFVNGWSWESAPSPVSAMVEKRAIDGAALAGFDIAPDGGYGIDRIRIYRTQAGETGGAFYFLREIAASTLTTTDDLRDIGEPLPTTTWLPAPGIPQGGAANHTEPTMSRLTPMWNGMLAGIVDGVVRVCESYAPYAWPIAYDVRPPDSKALAIGVFGQTMVVTTTGNPLLVTGSSPDGLDQIPIEMQQGCVSADSTVSMGTGVAWASNDGLCWYGAGGPRILTAALMMREDWQRLRPETIIGCMYEGAYFGSYQPEPGGPRKGFLIDPSGGTGIFFQDEGFDAAFFDKLQDQLYILRGTSIMKWEGGAGFAACTARSALARGVRPVSMAVGQLVASRYPVQATVWADGVQLLDVEVQDREPFRLPGDELYMDWQAELRLPAGADECAVQSLVLGLSVDDLASA